MKKLIGILLIASAMFIFSCGQTDKKTEDPAPVTNSTGQGDLTAPSAPTGLIANAVSSSQIDLTWSASTDDVGVTGYEIYRGGTKIATSATNSYSNTGLTASTQYCYTVLAYDAASHNSAQSTQTCATTQSGGSATYDASGTYSWNSSQKTLSLTLSSTNYPSDCGGPSKIGTTETHINVSVTSTSMTWPDANDGAGVTWTRDSGTAGDITGTWYDKESLNGSTVTIFTAVMNSNNTLSVSSDKNIWDTNCASEGGGGGVSSATATDFAGTWEGPYTFVLSDESGSGTLVMVLTANGTNVAGTVYNKEQPTVINTTISGNVNNGTFSYTVALGSEDTNNPDCTNWNLTGYSTLNDAKNSMPLTWSGTVCGNGGGQSITLTGTLAKK